MNPLVHLLTLPHAGIAAWMLVAGLKIATLLSCCAIPALVLRRPAARHGLWAAGLAGSLLILAAGALPGWQIRLRSVISSPAPSASAAGSVEAPAGSRRPRPRFSESPAIESMVTSRTAAVLPKNSASRVRKAMAWDAWIGGLWLAGAALFFLPVILAAIALRRLKSQSKPVTSPTGVAALWEMSALLQIQKEVTLSAAETCRVPLAFGLRHSRIVLPLDHANWSGERWRVVLLHELAHIRRHDLLIQFLGELCRSLAWFHPLVWLARSRMAIEAEKACDDLALQNGADAPTYAATLLEFAAGLQGISIAGFAAVHMARRSTLETRIRRVLSKTAARDARAAGVRLLSVAVITLATGIGVLRAAAPATAGPPAALSISLRFIGDIHDDSAEEVADPRGYLTKLRLLRESVLTTEAIRPQYGITVQEAITNQQRITLPVMQAALDQALAAAADHPARQNEPVALLQIGEKRFLIAAVSDASFDATHGDATTPDKVCALGLSLPYGVGAAKAQEIAAQLNGKPICYLTGIVKDRGLREIPSAGFTLGEALAPAIAKGEIPATAEIVIEKQGLRQVSVRATIAFADLHRDALRDLPVQPNDIVVVLAGPPPAAGPAIVAKAGVISLLGHIDQPGVYSIKDAPTLKSAIRIAGSDGMPTCWFGMEAVVIRRVKDHEASRTTVDLADLFAGTVDDPVLGPNDVLDVVTQEEVAAATRPIETKPRAPATESGLP